MITILCTGKIKEKYLTDLIKDYQLRIAKYHNVKLVEIKDTNIDEEKDNLLKQIKGKDYVIGLDIKGKIYNSCEFSQKIFSIFNFYPNIVFIIGGSNGLHQEVKKKCNELISFSAMTFPHGLFRGLLLEQIYRAFKIYNNESYHK